MDVLADELDVSPPALRLLGAYAEAIAEADRARGAKAKAEAKAAAAAPPAEANVEAGEGEGEGGSPAAPQRIVAVPRLAPGTHPADAHAAPAGDAADLHGVLLAAGALDVDLSDVTAGVRYTVTRHGRSLLAEAA